MFIRLIEFDKNTYVLGLDWFSIQSKKAIPKKMQKDFDVYCQSASKKQFGLCKTDEDDDCLTNALANMFKPNMSFIGVFRLVDMQDIEFKYVLAIHDGLILIDRCYTLEQDEQIQKDLQSLTDLGSMPVSPVYFDTIVESLNFFRENFAVKKFSFNKIKPLYASKKELSKKAKFVIAALAVFGLIYGGMYYLDIKKLADLRAGRLFSEQSLEAQKKNIYENVHKYFKMDWQKKHFPLDVYNVCQPVLFNLPMVVNGWILEKAICSNEISSYWQHQNQASFIELPYNGVLNNPKEVLAKHEIADITLVQENIDYTSLLTKDESSKIMYQLTQNMGANLTLNFDKQDVKEFKELKISIQSPWAKAKFEWKSVPARIISENSLFIALNAIPSLSITKIEYSNEKWSITGEFYAKV